MKTCLADISLLFLGCGASFLASQSEVRWFGRCDLRLQSLQLASHTYLLSTRIYNNSEDFAAKMTELVVKIIFSPSGTLHNVHTLFF